MGSPRAPRLIDITWGKDSDPKITLVGKGVCFDTGGLDIKPSSGMLNMKKDMGGSATALGLAHMIMAAKLKLRLRVLIPAVENSVSGKSFRPRDVFKSRKGITVEIGNTDAEGRLVLADALALADEEKPELIADFATLTGAARVALGTDLPAMFTDDDALATELSQSRTGRKRSGLAAAAVEALRGAARFESLRHQQCLERRLWRRDHRGAVPAEIRQRQILGSSRHLCLERFGQTGPAGRRRTDDRARGLCAVARAVFVNLMTTLDPRVNPFRRDIAAKHLEGRVEAAQLCRGHAARGHRADRRSAARPGA